MREVTIPLFLYIMMLVVCCGDILTMILNRMDKSLEKKLKLVKEKWLSYYLGSERNKKGEKEK